MARGFTTVELTTVLIVLGIVAVVGLPLMGGLVEQSRLEAARAEIRAALEYAQVTAMASGCPCRVTIASGNNSVPWVLVEKWECGYAVGHVNLAEIDEATFENKSFQVVGYPMKPGVPYNLNFGEFGRFRGVALVSSDFGGETPVVFDARGVPSRGGTVVLSYGTQQVSLVVDPLTGTVN